MNDSEIKAIDAIPELQSWADQFLESVENGFPVKNCPNDDHWGFMALTFLAKQTEHLRSIRILDDNRDCGMIARSMIEGLIQLKWAQKEDLALHWKTFPCVSDYKLLLAGHDPSKKREVEAFFHLHEKKFRKKDYVNNDSPPLEKAYHKNWRCGKSFKDICPTDLKYMYDEVYSKFSDWSHWGPHSIGGSIDRSGNRFLFAPKSLSQTGLALCTGVHCLIKTAEVVDSCVEGKPFKELEEVAKRYESWCEEALIK